MEIETSGGRETEWMNGGSPEKRRWMRMSGEGSMACVCLFVVRCVFVFFFPPSLRLDLQMILIPSLRGRLRLARFPEEEEPPRGAEHNHDRNNDADDGASGQPAGRIVRDRTGSASSGAAGRHHGSRHGRRRHRSHLHHRRRPDLRVHVRDRVLIILATLCTREETQNTSTEKQRSA